MLLILRSTFSIHLIFILCGANAQHNGKNYPLFEHKEFHGGTMLGATSSTYAYQLNSTELLNDSVQHISLNKMPGLSIHIPVIEWNPHPTFNLVTSLSISFHETEFVYNYLSKGKLKTKTTRNQPVLLNFPLLMKLSTKRLSNFGAYSIMGLSYSYDLASQEKVDQTLGEPIMKLKKHDFAYHFGGGFEFYLPYFRFGIEIKLSNGITNLLIQDNTFFSSPLTSLKSKTWWFSITFEG